MANPESTKLLAEWFWTDRWIGSSAFLLPIEPRGLYREMLTQAWRRGARLPNDHEAIRRAIGCTRQEWARCWPKVERFWRVVESDLVNDTQLQIWTAAMEARQRASERGKKGAAARGTSTTQAEAQAENKRRTSRAQGKHKHKPPSPSLSSSENKNHSLNSGSGADAPTAGEGDADLLDGVTNQQVSGFLRRFCELYSRYRHGAKYFVKSSVHVPLIRQLLRVFDAARLEKIAVVLLTTDDEWTAGTDRGIGILSTKASWIDGLIAEHESKHGEILVAS